jgi:hypothetical protein
VNLQIKTQGLQRLIVSPPDIFEDTEKTNTKSKKVAKKSWLTSSKSSPQGIIAGLNMYRFPGGGTPFGLVAVLLAPQPSAPYSLPRYNNQRVNLNTYSSATSLNFTSPANHAYF